MARRDKSADIAQAEQDILLRLDVLAEYRALGVVFASEKPRSSGMIECYSRSRDEKKPSAAVSTKTGRYLDSGSAESFSLWDFAAKFGSGFATWQDARKHFADKTGVKISGAKQEENPLDQLEFHDWHSGHDSLADIWCRKHKKGATLEALKLAGGRIGQYPCRLDKESGQRKKGEFKVVALPCYGEKLLDANPVAWVMYNLGGGTLPVWRGKGLPPDQVKMKSVGPTRGAMMNTHALSVLADETRSAGVELIWSTAGPSDLLSLLAAIPPELRDHHLVLANASGETGDILPHQSALFAGRKAGIIRDRDEAGAMSNVKWAVALGNVASELRTIHLPFRMAKKHGKDLRDYLNGVPEDADWRESCPS